jgi:hypothetical protein
VIDAAALHRAAERVADGAGTPWMDALADAGAVFIHESDLADELGVPFTPDPRAIGYGVMLGYLAARDELGAP